MQVRLASLFRIDRLLEAKNDNSPENNTHCIFFSQERRKEAFQLAVKLQEQGVRTVLQDINGVKNLDAFTKNFAETTFLVGIAGKEPVNG